VNGAKVVAPVDLESERAETSVQRALTLAKALRADLTLLSIMKRRRFERGHREPWPEIAFDDTDEVAAIHRVVVPGPAEEAIPRYADQIDADFVLLGKEHLARRWFRRSSVAVSVAAASRRALFIVPDDDVLALRGPRVACVGSGPGHPAHRAAANIVKRCAGQLRAWPAPSAQYQLVDAAMLEGIDLMVATDCGGSMLSIARRLPCALLLLKPEVRSLVSACPR
jgi:nucleotide-binding universal stress UspA family protein